MEHPLSALKIRRELMGITAPALAKMVGVTGQSLYRYESGERRIYLDKALTLAVALRCSVEDLGRYPPDEEVPALLKMRGEPIQTGVPVSSEPEAPAPITTEPRPIETKEELEAFLAEWQ